jgi:outer membrane protein
MRKLLVAIAAIVCLSSVQAQSKVAHVNTDKVLDTLPSMKKAKADLEQWQAVYKAELDELNSNLEKMYSKYMAERDKLTPMMQQYEEERIQKKNAEFQQRQQEIEQDLYNKSNSMQEPVLERVKKAIEVVAERKKLNYVINENVTLYSKGGMDITNEVITEALRLEKEAAATAPSTPATPK